MTHTERHLRLVPDLPLPVEFIPSSQLEVGLRVIRAEHCARCARETQHVFTLVDMQPRTWVYACQRCQREN